MTKKDYILIANVFAQRDYFHTECIDDAKARVENILTSEYMADALEADNPRFDRERFLAACHKDNYKREV